VATNRDVRTVFVAIHLGGAPSFDIQADEDASATPRDCRLSGQGTGPADRDFLLDILHKIANAYGNAAALSVCIQNGQITRDPDCR
jgi:hypothetical protein